MKISIIAFLISFSLSLFSQSLPMDVFPPRTASVDDQSYNKGKHILTNSYQAVKESDNGVCYADYWNVAYGMALMGGETETIFTLLTFCKVAYYQIDSKNSTLENMFFYKLFGDRYRSLLDNCEILKQLDSDPNYNTKIDLDLNGLNEGLIDQLIVMNEKDQRFRNMNADYEAHWEEQTTLDKENQEQLTKIFETYGYPGKALVGERFMNSACLIFEHGGSIKYQQKYFPLIIEAMNRDEVIKPVVRMLVDRIHWKTTGKQIFGSHMDIPFDSDKVINKYKRKYNL